MINLVLARSMIASLKRNGHICFLFSSVIIYILTSNWLREMQDTEKKSNLVQKNSNSVQITNGF